MDLDLHWIPSALQETPGGFWCSEETIQSSEAAQAATRGFKRGERSN